MRSRAASSLPSAPRAGAALALVALAATVLPAPASATLSEALSLDELVARSTHVVLGEAVRQQARRDARGRIVTDIELRVLESLRGPARAGEALTLLRLGGVLGDLGMRVTGEPTFENGRRYVVFLRPLGSGALRPVGMSQGVLPVEDDGHGAMVLPGGAGLGLVRRGPDGQLHGASPAVTEPVPYERLRERILVPTHPAPSPSPLDP